MRTHIADEGSQLNRRAMARSWASKRPVEAYHASGRDPVFFIQGELLVNAADTELIDELVSRGGRVTRTAEDPPMPEEFRRLGLGRDPEVDMSRAPSTVKIYFDEVPPPPDNVEDLLAEAWPRLENVEWTSASAQGLAALIAPMRARGRRVSLNRVADSRTLPHLAPIEGGGQDPLTWPCLNKRTRITSAWQLVESMRLMRTVSSPVEFIAIHDVEFDTSLTTDIGTGLVRWNSATDKPGIPVPPPGSTFHGVEVAGVAAAAVGNLVGTAGAGGTVALPCFFDTDRTVDAVMTTVRRCTQWGIRIVNISAGFVIDQDDIEDDWVDMFNWAADNGVLIVCASPNGPVNLSGGKGDFPSTISPRVLAVGAHADDETWFDSAFGTGVDLYAPGKDIPLVATPFMPIGNKNNGTSYAAPLVAGTAAMMRAVNPSLTPDQLHSIIINTAWPGAGRVNRGLDAYAAVWEAMRLQMAETISESPDERLYPAANGMFKPIFNDGFNRAGDTDTFLLDAKAFSNVTVRLRWYNRLAKVTLDLEGAKATITEVAPGELTLAADVGSGTYRLTVRGSGASAYLLTGQITPGILLPDRFEPNNSFDEATELRCHPRGKWEAGGILAAPWGPGTFDLNLHSEGLGPVTTDVDYFVINTPAAPGVLDEWRVQITYSDEPLEVTLYDAARNVLVTHRTVRSVPIGLPASQTVYLKVSGPVHTRYGIWTGKYFHDEEFRRVWPEIQLLPKWWEQNIVDRFTGPQEQRGLQITPELINDGVLTFGGANGQALPDGVSITLLDKAGAVVSEGSIVDGRAVISLDGVSEDAYVVSATLEGTALEVATASGLGFAMQPPALRH